MNSWVTYRSELQQRASFIQKHIKIHIKEGWFWTTVGWILFILSFGKLTRERFALTAIALGNHHFYPRAWSYESVNNVLPHEADHTRWCYAMGLFIHPLVGFPFFALAYLFVPVPILFAYFRFRAELSANLTKWSHNEVSGEELLAQAQRFADSISGPSYFWSVPKKFAEDQTLKAIAEHSLLK